LPAGTDLMADSPPITLPKPLVLVGLMGAGKSAVGRRLAGKLNIPFIDADSEIEAAAGCSIEEIFARHGEPAFRDGERRVVARLLETQPMHVLATGGGAFIDPSTRALIREQGISIWLRANLDILFERVSRRSHRPLLKTGDPRAKLADLMEERYPIYAEADIIVDSGAGPIGSMVDRVIVAIAEYLSKEKPV